MLIHKFHTEFSHMTSVQYFHTQCPSKMSTHGFHTSVRHFRTTNSYNISPTYVPTCFFVHRFPHKEAIHDFHTRCPYICLESWGYCPNCEPDGGKEFRRGGERYVLPVNWCRFGLHVDAALCTAENVWKEWHTSFHGTPVPSPNCTLWISCFTAAALYCNKRVCYNIFLADCASHLV